MPEIYRIGKSIAADKRLNEAGRRARVEQLVDAVCDCTGARFADETKPADAVEKDFFNLTHEIVRLMADDELFKPVDWRGRQQSSLSIPSPPLAPLAGEKGL